MFNLRETVSARLVSVADLHGAANILVSAKLINKVEHVSGESNGWKWMVDNFIKGLER